jgi:hypothetical protein
MLINSNNDDCVNCSGNVSSTSSCRGCACDQLRRLQTNTEVDVFLASGIILEDVVFVSFDPNNCCAFFNDPTTEPGSIIVVDCNFIQAIRFEAD